MQSRVQVSDGPQPQEFDPPIYLPVSRADLEGGTQSRRTAVQISSSHFQVDSVPKLRRCFCCATLVLLSLIQALMLDHLDPAATAWKVVLKSKRRVAQTVAATPKLLESAGTPGPLSLPQSLLVSTPAPGTTMPDPSLFGVLYLMLTHHKNYGTKIAGVLSTWGEDVQTSALDSLLMVGDEASEDPPILPAKGCGNDHNDQLVCKAGVALQLAHQRLGNFSWVFLVDDDFYLNVANAHRALASFDPTQAIAVGIVGCGGHLCPPAGFCGGGGFAISRRAMEKIMEKGEGAFQTDLMSHIAKEKNGIMSWADISVSCLLRRNKIPLLTMKGLYPFKVDGAGRKGSSLNEGYIKAIHQTHPLPVTFHYITEEQKREIHQEFRAMNESQVSGSRKLRPVEFDYDAQVACFIAKVQQRQAQSDTDSEPISIPDAGTCA
eukprot:s1204_g10.t1